MRKDLKCIACELGKRRRNLVIFVQDDYSCNTETVQKLLCNLKGNDENRVRYICQKCSHNLKKPSHACERKDSKLDHKSSEPCFCTCCHSQFMRKQVVLFEKKNYDFKNKSVNTALGKNCRYKKCIYEYICKTCHGTLRKRRDAFPSIPNNAFCRTMYTEKSSNECGNSGKSNEKRDQCQHRHLNWNNTLAEMGLCNNFDDLVRCVDRLGELPALSKNFKGIRQSNGDKRDYLAYDSVPVDVGISKDELFPVSTSGAGSCFYYALSRLVYGNENHCVEMRVRVVVEGIRNMNLYLDHDYLCRNYDFPYGHENNLCRVYATYASFYDARMDLSVENIRDCYKREMFNLRRFSCESGIWQFHQAANVLGCRIQSVYPHLDVNLCNLRQDFHRVILPLDLDNAENIVRIMWTKCNWNSVRFGHFVPLVDRVFSLPIIDVNLRPLDFVEKEAIVSEVDLTEEMDVESSSNLSTFKVCESVASKSVKQFENSITETHEIVEEKVDIDMDVEKIDDIDIADCDQVRMDGVEMGQIKDGINIHEEMEVDTNVRSVDECSAVQVGPFYCTSCHHAVCTRSNVKIFKMDNYNFESDIVKSVLHDQYRCKSDDGKEYICQSCSKNLQKIDPKVPRKSVYNIEKRKEYKVHAEEVGKEMSREKSISKAGEKFRRSCQQLPEFVCTCCHRMLFMKSVLVFDVNKYELNGPCVRVLEDHYRFKDDNKENEFICQTCHRDLKKNKLPVQAVANMLEVPGVPEELQGLTRLECRCIGLRIPFMMLRALRKGGLGQIRGPCVNVPATLEPIAKVLPRVPENIDLVLLKFKRMITYKSNYMCDYIRPQKVMTALLWLKENNPHYSHVEIDHDWLEKFRGQEISEHIFDNVTNQKMIVDEELRKMSCGNEKKSTAASNGSKQSSNGKNVTECDKMDDSAVNVDHVESSASDNSDLEDQNLEEAQNHFNEKAEITIGGTSTCMQFKNLDDLVISIAPGQDAVPKYILMDNDFEVLAFPDLFPGGFGGFDVLTPRDRDINLRRYVNQRLLNKDPRFSQNSEYIFAFQYATEIKQLRTDMQMALKRRSSEGRKINAGDMRNFEKVNQLIWKDIAYKFMKNVRGTPAFWQSKLFDTLAMLRTFGTPTWFISLSPAEFLWPEFIQAVGKRMRRNWSEDEISTMEWINKAEYFRNNSVPVNQMFENRIESFFSDFLLNKANPLGEITEHIEKIEFQVRGSPHAHCLLWVKDAPRVDVNTEEEVCDFVDKYICGKIPSESEENEELRNLVMKLQTHRHSPCCRKHVNGRCRFNFPRPPSTKTILARSSNDYSDVKIDEKDRRHILQLIHERIEAGDGATLKEILESECIPEEMYLDCLRMTSQRGTNVILQRDVGDCNTNNFNAHCLQLWHANIDIQYIADPYSCIMYVLSYVMKCENGMSEILKRVAKEYKDETVQKQMKEVLYQFANKREVSVHEAVKRVLSQWLFRKSRCVVFVNNSPAEERHRMTKHQWELAELDDDDEDIFKPSIHDRYASRPKELESMCLAEFATKFSVGESSSGERTIELIDKKLGKMVRRTKDAVLRTHRFSDDTYKYYYSKLLLFWPWCKEEQLLEGYGTYQEHYADVKNIVEGNASPFNMNCEEIEEAFDDFVRNPPTVSEWLESGVGNEDLSAEDLANDGFGNGNEEVQKDYESPLSLKYKAEAVKDTISSEEYCVMMRNLNKEQREIVMFNRKWMKESIVKMKEGKVPDSYQIFLSGPGGTGKSYVIKMIYRDNIKFFRRFFVSCDSNGVSSCNEDVIALMCAYTGTAAFNIDGMTLHSAFQLTNEHITDERKVTMQTRLSRLQQVTIDEVSMLGSKHFTWINNRCSMVKNRHPNSQDFGKVNILAVGDLYQLAPVMQRQVFCRNYSEVGCASDLAPIIWDKFLFHELTQIMRQRNSSFAQMLNLIRLGKPEENSEVDKMLKGRELKLDENDPNYPNGVLHVYALNVHCNVRNEKMLNHLNGQLYISQANDSLQDIKINMSEIDLSNLPTSKTGNLAKTLLLKVGARVFVSTNIDVSDGLTNGVFGTVSHIVTTRHQNRNGNVVEEIRVILVRFDSEKVGREARAKSVYKNLDSEAVPIHKTEVMFQTRSTGEHKKTIRVVRKQFPLVLAWAVTIHKVQGMTMDRIVVDMSRDKGNYMKGQAYVAFSRVRTLEGLHIINYSRHQIRTCGKVKKEMDRLRNERKLPSLPEALIWSIPKETISMVHLNIQGLHARSRTKQLDVQMDNELQKVDILCLTETHFEEDDVISLNSIWNKKKGTLYRRDRIGRKGGGAAIVVSDKFRNKRIPVESQLELVAVEVYCPDKVIIICVYIPPSVNKIAAGRQMESLLKQIGHSSDKIIVVGDFNEDLIDGKDNKVVNKFFTEMGFSQEVVKATTDYGSLLDHIYCKNLPSVLVDVQDTYYTDHDKVFVFFK